MLKEDPKQRVSARRALMQLGEYSEVGFFHPQGMNAEEQAKVEKDDDGMQWE